ncbi:MAG: electron transport complex subunit RsxE, partial [Candidatus Eisenbacteria bacterium]|nr:electron transport complex subunit RsxE [Candidatus Eisenbacteria bacterium]
MARTPLSREFTKGLWEQNPILKQVLGTCPTLAVTNSAVNGFAMGLATGFVLLMSSTLVGL